MIEIKNLKKNKHFSMNDEYYSIIEKEKKQELLLKDNFLNKFGFSLDKIILNVNDFLLRYQIQDKEFEDFIYSKKEIDFSISYVEPSEKKEKLEYSIKSGILITTEFCLNNSIDMDYKKKLTNQILKNIPEMISFIEEYKDLFISIIKRNSLENLYLKEIFKYKNVLINFKQHQDKINQDFENFILKLKKNKNLLLNFLIYDKSYSNNFQCNVLNIHYKKEGYFYGFNKITKKDLFLLFKNSFYINNEYYHNLESEEQVKVFKYINSKKFIEQLELMNKLESF